jgi:hypothetical protein
MGHGIAPTDGRDGEAPLGNPPSRRRSDDVILVMMDNHSTWHRYAFSLGKLSNAGARAHTLLFNLLNQ